MTARRISDIVKALMRSKKLGAKLTGRSAFEKELNAWINGELQENNHHVIPNPCNIGHGNQTMSEMQRLHFT